MPLFCLLQTIHGLCLLLDEVLFPGYRRTALDGTVIITGVPRSGTTFLHRTLSIDSQRYVSMTTWEAVLAPSILQRRVISVLASVDHFLGGWGRRGLRKATRGLAGGLDDIHSVSLEDAEEDYLALLPYAACFVMLLAFPAEASLRRLAAIDWSTDSRWRQRLIKGYLNLLRRQRYADPQARQILSKNAAFGSWVESLHKALPEARFIICLREPVQALSSQISSVTSAATLFGTATDSDAFQRFFLEMYAETLQHLSELQAQAWAPGALALLDMDDLRRAPMPIIAGALQRLSLEPSTSLMTFLQGLPVRGASQHAHEPEGLAVSAQECRERLVPPYQRLMACPHRVHVHEG